MKTHADVNEASEGLDVGLQLPPFGPIDFWIEIENEVTGWKRVGEIFFDDFEEKKTRLETERRSLPK